MSVNKRLPNGTLQPIAGLGTYNLNDLKQYTTFPTPSSANEGLVIQYVGTDSTNYTVGGVYQCQESSGSYSWVLLSGNIQQFYQTAVPTNATVNSVWISDTDIPDVSA